MKRLFIALVGIIVTANAINLKEASAMKCVKIAMRSHHQTIMRYSELDDRINWYAIKNGGKKIVSDNSLRLKFKYQGTNAGGFMVFEAKENGRLKRLNLVKNRPESKSDSEYLGLLIWPKENKFVDMECTVYKIK